MPGQSGTRWGGRARQRWLGDVVALAALAVAASCGSPAVTRAPATPARSASGSAAPSASAAVDPALLAVLQKSWEGYKQAFIQADGRVVDPMRGGLTTSEGQSYALLRAAWMGDRAAFDLSWHWTMANLQVRGDGLFASLWDHGAVQDHNTATDADSDIALALLFATRRFDDTGYRTAAHAVLNGMWSADVATINGMNVVTGGNWATAQRSPGPVVNPSYLAPYAYRLFAREDTTHPWMTLVDSSYTMLDRCTSATLGATTSAGLPPNWCAVSRSSGAIVAFPQISGADNFGYDAFRVMWRVAVDALWNKETRATDYLQRHDFLRRRWSAAQHIDAVYTHDGKALSSYDDPTVYGGDVGNFVVAAPDQAREIAGRLMASFHDGSPAHFGDAGNYFEQNWVWFGLALSGAALPNLAGG